MKKILFSILFIVFSLNSISLSAQSIKDSNGINSKSDTGLEVYPNPAKEFIFLKTKDDTVKIKSITFYSILGIEISNFNINTNFTELRLDRLKPGKYLMKYLLSDGNQKITQIIKQ